MWKKGTLCITIAANIAYSAILNFDACFPDSVLGFISNKLTTNLFMKYYLDYYKQYLEKLSVGCAQSNLNLEKLSKIKIKIPKIDEQKKISFFI